MPPGLGGKVDRRPGLSGEDKPPPSPFWNPRFRKPQRQPYPEETDLGQKKNARARVSSPQREQPPNPSLLFSCSTDQVPVTEGSRLFGAGVVGTAEASRTFRKVTRSGRLITIL